MKEFGEGVDRMFRELHASGNSEPHFETNGFIVKASIYQQIDATHEIAVRLLFCPVLNIVESVINTLCSGRVDLLRNKTVPSHVSSTHTNGSDVGF